MVTIGGPIIGGALADAGLWRYIFFINVPLGIISILILWFRVKDTRDEETDHVLDYPGAFASLADWFCLRSVFYASLKLGLKIRKLIFL
jgi:MFS family permease